MRILVISQYFPPDRGGGSKRVINALTELKRRGHQVEVIAAFPHYPHGAIPKKLRKKAFTLEHWRGSKIFRVWVPSVPHIGFLRRLFLYLTFAASALAVMPLVSVTDIVWAANSNVFSSLPAAVFGFLKKAPIVRNVDDLWPEAAIEEGYLRNGILAKVGRSLAKFAYRFCRALSPISAGYKREIVNRYHIPSEKIHVVEVGVDIEKFRPVQVKKRKEFTITYSGILGTGYNLDYLVEVANLCKSDKNIIFQIHGFGERENELRKTISEEKIANLLLSTNYLSLEQLVKLLNSSDLLFLPMNPMKAHEAGLPTKLLEYMAVGKPIVCSSEGEAANIVKKAKCGLVVSPRNPNDAVEAIMRLKGDKTLREEMGRNGRLFAERHLSLEQIGRKLEMLFKVVIDS